MNERDLFSYGEQLGRTPTPPSMPSRQISGDDIEAIIAGRDAGFTCPSCGEYTESSPCICGTLISQTGQKIALPSTRVSDTGIGKPSRNKTPKKFVGRPYEYERKKFTLFSANSIGNDRISIHIQYFGKEYTILFTPGICKTIDSISEKTTRFKKKRVPPDVYNDFVIILGELSRNPDTYGLSKLKAFKK